jgi:hypothetical protein
MGPGLWRITSKPNTLKTPQNGNLQALHVAGGEALRPQDVRNAGSQWLQASPNPRERDREEAVDDEFGAPAQRKLKIWEFLDNLPFKYDGLEEVTKEWDPNLRDKAIRGWINTLERITEPLRKGTAEDLKNHILSRQGEMLAGQGSFPESACSSLDRAERWWLMGPILR